MPEQMEAEAVAQEATQAETTSTPWYSDEYKDVVSKKGWKTGDDALKSYSELEKAMGQRVKIPDEKSTPEERQKFYQKIGVPDSPDGYQVQLDESVAPLRDEGTEKQLAAIAHQNGVPKAAFEKMVNTYYSTMADRMQRSFEEGTTKLRDEWGDKYKENVKIAQQFTQNASPEFQELLEVSGLGNNPTFIKEFAALGKKTLNDSLIKGENINPDEKGYKPAYPDSPDMYKYGEDEASVKARAYFTRRGHKY